MTRIVPMTAGIVLTALTFALPASATTFDITGATSKNENWCSAPLPVFLGEDCTYNRIIAAASPDIAWIGPIGGDGYYTSDPGERGEASARSGIPITGQVTVDGNGASASVSMTFAMASMFRNYANGAASSATDGWTSITHSFSGRTVTTGTANGIGGYDYTIGILPTVLTMRSTNEPFPADVGAVAGVVAAPPVWNLPGAGGAPGIAAVEGNTSGVATTASVLGYTCSGTCASVVAWDTNAKAAFDNMLLRFRTDANGNLVDGFAFLVNDVDVLNDFLFPGIDSWTATTMSFSGSAAVVPVPAAAWLLGPALGALGLIRRRQRLSGAL